MNIKLFVFTASLICAISIVFALPSPQLAVAIPADCAQSCPPGGQKLCARNAVTKQLGTFDSDCIFGRFNSCVKTMQKYEFVKYGEC